MSIIGRMLTKRAVVRAVQSTLTTWLPDYQAALEEQEGLNPGALDVVRDIVRVDELSSLPDDALPCIAILADPNGVSVQGDGVYAYTYRVQVGVFVSGSDYDDTDWRRDALLAIVRSILVQQCDLDGIASSLDIIEESQPEIDFDKKMNRTVGAAAIAFDVLVEDVARRHGGPVTPSGETPGVTPADWPVIETHDEVVQTTET